MSVATSLFFSFEFAEDRKAKLVVNMNDISNTPIPEIKACTWKHRQVGSGVSVLIIQK